MSDIPHEVDWVSERAKCDIKSAFELLRQAVEKDVERYKALPGFLGQIEFSSEPDWMFCVCKRSTVMKSVVFNRENDHIAINSNARAAQPLKVVPILSEIGHIKFRIGGEEDKPLFSWQLRLRVLEPLLFLNQGA